MWLISIISYVHSFSYLKGAKLGDVIEVDANTVRAGKTLAYLDCVLRLKGSGEIIATGTHTKFIGTNSNNVNLKDNNK